VTTPRWIYKVRWSNPYTYDEARGLDYELAAAEVTPGAKAPEELERIAQAHPGYGVHLGFAYAPRKQWSAAAKGSARAKRMKARIQKAAPLFADELIERELAERASYFKGQ